SVTPADVQDFVRTRTTSAEAEAFFKEKGLNVRVPPAFDYRLLDHLDVIEFKGRRVAKLSFSFANSNADVLILPAREFRTDALQQDNSIRIEPDGEFTYLIYVRGDLGDLRRAIN